MSVGETLTQAREQRKLSVEDVSAATRIRAGLIRSIEADDFTGCGGAVYARGHIRSIARAVDIDAEPLIAEFDAAHAADAAPPLVPTTAIDQEAAARADRRRPNWAAAMAVALAVICVLAAVSLLSNHRSPRKAEADLPRPEPSRTAVAPPQQSTAPTPPPDAVAHVPDDAIAQVRVTSSQTWLSVQTFSGKLLFQGLLSAGEHKLFRDAKGLRLTIGNAPAVDLVANGQDVGAPKSQGNVAHVTIAKGGELQYA